MSGLEIKRDLDGIEGLCLVIPKTFGDSRGYFMEAYNLRDMEDAGLNIKFVQDNQSVSTRGVLRGLHYQINHPQTKLARVVQGEVFDVAVDLRKGSKTYGRWHGELLSDENNHQFLIPHGFAHGLLVLSERAIFTYKCDDYYHPNDEGGIAWNDPDIGITWPGVVGKYCGSANSSGCFLDGKPLTISEKDQQWVGLTQL